MSSAKDKNSGQEATRWPFIAAARRTVRGLRFVRSTAFLFTLRYIALFGGSVALLLAFIYISTIGAMEEQIENSANIQLADLGRKLTLDGPRETITAIEHLIAKDASKSAVYLLINPRWQIVAGNMERWPGGSTASRNWIRFTIDSASNPEFPTGKFLAINTALPGGFILLVGGSLQSVEKVEQIILQVFWICMALTLALGAVGGVYLARHIGRRLEMLNVMCARVMAGAMDERVPVSGADDEFDHLAENFNHMLARIGELIDGIRDISASVAHDLRTPLNRLRHRLERLEHSASLTPQRTKEELRLAITEIDALVSTFNAILRIAQAESGAQVERFEPFDLSGVMQDLCDLYEALAEDRRIAMHCTIEENVTAYGDRHLLTQAFANLLDNAIKYTPQHGRIEVRLTRSDEEIRITIADNGPGIPHELYGRVTEKFFRLEQSRSTPGNGLGLSLAKAAVSLHHGELIFSGNHPGLRVDVLLRKESRR